MPTYKLASGHSVATQRNTGSALIEFTTRNAEGDVISTVNHSFPESIPLIHRLQRASVNA